ncbi:MAG: Mrp/NBP35 family ATP-binding protein [Chloroflexota bacterium]
MVNNKIQLTEEVILNALRNVQDPELHKDLVTLGMIKNVKIENDKVSVDLILTTPACPLRNELERNTRSALAAVPGINEVDVHVSANVPHDQRLRRKIDLPVKNAIAVGSGKGGVGKSTIAVNLAIALAQSGAKVGLLDADIYGPNIPTMMGVHTMPPGKNQKMEPAENYGVKIMSIGFIVGPDQPLIWRGPMLHSAIQQFIGEVNWGELDYLVIDLPPGTGDAPLSLAQTIPLSGGVVVTLPQQVSIEDARRGVEMFRKMDVPVLGVVENMSYLELPDGTRMDIFGTGGGQHLAEEACVPFLGSIPMDPEVRKGGDAGEPILISQPDSDVAQAMLAVAKAIAAQISISTLSQEKE